MRAPLLDGELAAAGQAAVREVVAKLGARHELHLSGHVARALLFDEVERAEIMGTGDGVGEALQAALDVVVARRGTLPIGLAGGVAGTGWVVARLTEGETTDEVCAAIDDVILAHATEDLPYDLLHGFVGLGIYGIERRESAAGRAIATRVIAALEARTSGGTWLTPPAHMPPHDRAMMPEGYINLGIAHGVPGVIGLLARMVEADVEAERTRRLLDDAVAWLLGLCIPSRYPAYVGSVPTRLAWCYGDPGVALSLLSASRATGERAWGDAAIELGLAMTKRPRETTGVIDAGLCHGAAGLGHIFHRLYRATAVDAFADAARGWFADALERGRFFGDDDDATLLTGAPGIALALIAATTDREPHWDRLLLADVPFA